MSKKKFLFCLNFKKPESSLPKMLPVIVPIHLKKFSFSGNAETLFSVLIIRAISSFCNLLTEAFLIVLGKFKLIQSEIWAKLLSKLGFYLFETLPFETLDSSWLLLVALGTDSGFMFWLVILIESWTIKTWNKILNWDFRLIFDAVQLKIRLI